MKWLVLPCLAFSLALAGCSESGQPDQARVLSGGTMGTYWSVKIPDGQSVDAASLQEGLETELEQVNAAMSTWREDSRISAFNAMEAGCMAVEAGFAEVVRQALQIAEATSGAYDVTIGPLVDLWGFGSDEGIEQPAQEQIEAGLARTGWQKLWLEEGRLCKSGEEVAIDLSSIAKGYGVDILADYLQARGITDFLADIGGELYAAGTKGGDPWRLGVERPQDDSAERQAMLVLPVSDRAVATSGDYRNFFVLDGQRYSHIIDPRSGRPVEHGAASATVVADSATLADGWATALMVMEPQAGLELAARQGLAAMLILRQEDGFEMRANALWRERYGQP